MPTRVLLVDDAVVVRHILKETLSKDSDIEIVGTANDGADALEKIPALKPQVVVLDVEMPKMDGIETLAVIRKRWPEIKVIMFSTLTSRGASATIDALLLGAHDYVTKPANVGSVTAAIHQINSELAPRIKALSSNGQAINAAQAYKSPKVAHSNVITPSRPAPTTTSASVIAPPARNISGRSEKISCIAIAVSTGGPNALAELIPQLPKDLLAPIVIVQHIPPMFSKALADRLNAKSALEVNEGIHGAQLTPGSAWIAPGDYHMTVRRDASSHTIELNQGPAENSCRPAADVLFRSVSATFGASVLGVVLTGMGSDGLKGSQSIVSAGGRVIAQDEQSSVVWGMPGAVAQAGLTDAVLPLDRMASEIVARVGTSTRPPALKPMDRFTRQ